MTSASTNRTLERIKYFYATCLLIFSGSLIFGLIFTEQTHLSHDVHPAVAFFVFILGIAWLTMVEGGQGAIVGLAPVHEDLYKDSHPKARMCTALVHKGDNLDRYLLGRQFMVILIVFTTEISGAATEGAELWGMPSWLINLMLSSGVATILFTCMVGQLNSEINGCHCMLDYINSYFAVFTVWVAMFIEFSGVLHICYVIQKVVAYLAGQPIQSHEPPRSMLQNIFFWGRCIMSFGILCFSFAVTMTALFNGQTKMFGGVPPGASVAIFFILLFVIGLLEGSQIAYFAVVKMRQCERGESFFTRKTCEILFVDNNRNLGRFLIGRQLMVVSCMFFIARITAVRLEDGEPNIFGVSDAVQGLFSTGLLGAHIVAVIGSVSWRLLSSAFPLVFLANPLTYGLLRVALFLEWTGLLHGAFVLAAIHKKLAGWKRDEVYIGTAEERAAMKMADDDEVLSVGAGHIVPETHVADYLVEDEMTLEEIQDLEHMLKERVQHVDERIASLQVEKENLKKKDDNIDDEPVDFAAA